MTTMSKTYQRSKHNIHHIDGGLNLFYVLLQSLLNRQAGIDVVKRTGRVRTLELRVLRGLRGVLTPGVGSSGNLRLERLVVLCPNVR